jgi:hypothetical protein
MKRSTTAAPSPSTKRNRERVAAEVTVAAVTEAEATVVTAVEAVEITAAAIAVATVVDEVAVVADEVAAVAAVAEEVGVDVGTRSSAKLCSPQDSEDRTARSVFRQVRT